MTDHPNRSADIDGVIERLDEVADCNLVDSTLIDAYYQRFDLTYGDLRVIRAAIRSRTAAQSVGMREALDDTANWLEGCLNCKTWSWDGLQRAAAEKALEGARAILASQPSPATTVEAVLEQSEKLDGTVVQTVRSPNGVEYQRQIGLTMLELLIQAGYDASLPHPESFKGFSYLKLADILNVPLTTPAPPEPGWLAPALEKAEQRAKKMPAWMRRDQSSDEPQEVPDAAPAYEKHAKSIYGTRPRPLDSLTHFYAGWNAALALSRPQSARNGDRT